MSDLQLRRDITLDNWRTFPASRYAFQHVSEFVPSADIVNGGGAAEPVGPGSLGDLTIRHRSLGETSIAGFLEATHGDCLVVMKTGKIVADWCAPHASLGAPHLVFSVSKSITAMLAGIAYGDGLLDPEAPISRYVETPPDCAYASARVRDLLDMTVRLDFIEDYLSTDGPFARYRRATLWNPQKADAPAETLRGVLSTLPRSEGLHGEVFYYASPNTDMLGLVLEAATGRRLHGFMAERLWTPMGAKGPARITVDREGSARAAGGMSVTAGDLARFGDVVMNDGRSRDGVQVIPADWIRDMKTKGDPKAWKAGGFPGFFPGGNYRSCWYVANDGRGGIAADGIHGQRLWIDPSRGVVVVKLSSFPAPSDDVASATDFEVLAQIAEAL